MPRTARPLKALSEVEWVCAVRGLQPRSHGYAHRSYIFGLMIWVRIHGTMGGGAISANLRWRGLVGHGQGHGQGHGEDGAS
jgi:hypothetical protein